MSYITIDSKYVNLDGKRDKNYEEENYYNFFCEDNKEKCSLENIFSNKPIWIAKSLFIYDQETKDCKWEREKDTEIRPAQGEVFYIKCKDKRYVMKIIPLKSSFFSSSLQDFNNEVEFLKKASKVDISPKILQVYIGEEWGIIIMENAGIPLYPYIKNFLRNIDIESGDINIKNIVDKKTTELTEDFYELYRKMHNEGICHNDLALRNITYSDEKNRMYFIDYGWATDEKDCKSDLREFFDDLSGNIGYFWEIFLDKIENKLKQNKDPYFESFCAIF